VSAGRAGFQKVRPPETMCKHEQHNARSDERPWSEKELFDLRNTIRPGETIEEVTLFLGRDGLGPVRDRLGNASQARFLHDDHITTTHTVNT
jgi:hypothetical protein